MAVAIARFVSDSETRLPKNSAIDYTKNKAQSSLEFTSSKPINHNESCIRLNFQHFSCIFSNLFRPVDHSDSLKLVSQCQLVRSTVFHCQSAHRSLPEYFPFFYSTIRGNRLIPDLGNFAFAIRLGVLRQLISKCSIRVLIPPFLGKLPIPQRLQITKAAR